METYAETYIFLLFNDSLSLSLPPTTSSSAASVI